MASGAGARVQDDDRERRLAALLRLERTGRRIGHDAFDEFGNPYELKTTSSASVGTGRDVGRAFIEKMRVQFFVVARTAVGKRPWQPADIIVVHPDGMAPWIQEKLLDRIEPDEELRDRTVRLLQGQCSTEELDRLNYLISRGLTYNNPKVSWAYLEEHGQRIDLDDPVQSLREFVARHPILTAPA